MVKNIWHREHSVNNNNNKMDERINTFSDFYFFLTEEETGAIILVNFPYNTLNSDSDCIGRMQ